MTRKYRKNQKKQRSCFVFSPKTVKLTQKALKLFAQALTKENSQPSKVVFAEETMQQVNNKLDAMNTSVGAACLTTFDYNEKVVIATAIQLYTLDLIALPSDPQRERELHYCKQIMYFVLNTGGGPKQ